jgi:hypothetical protein
MSLLRENSYCMKAATVFAGHYLLMCFIYTTSSVKDGENLTRMFNQPVVNRNILKCFENFKDSNI